MFKNKTIQSRIENTKVQSKNSYFAFISLSALTIWVAGAANAQEAAPIIRPPEIATPAPAAASQPVRLFSPSTQNITPLEDAEPIPVPVVIAPRIPNNGNEALAWGNRAANSSDWGEVRRLMSLTNSEAIKSALFWRIVTDERPGAGFSELEQGLRTLIGYPQMRDVRIRMEKNIDKYGLSNTQKIAFLTRKEAMQADKSPISGEGKMALAAALGDTQEARLLISEAWRKSRFDINAQNQYLSQFQSLITPEDHDARVNLLLWLKRTSQARPLIPFMTPEGRYNANARLGIANEEGAVIMGSGLRDPGILYERVRALRKADRNSEALDLLVQINSEGLPEPAQEDIWNERRILLVEAIRSKRWDDGYRIASQHGFSSGSKFADAEFSAGWIALRFLNQPQTALKHFERFDKAVSSSMSKSRGLYWLGRTHEVLGNQRLAQANYIAAAKYPTFYYGQLAIARWAGQSGQTAVLNLPPERKATSDDIARLNRQPMMEIARTYFENSDRDMFVKFAFALDDVLTSDGEHQALSEFARSRNEPLIGIRVAKAGLNRGILATEAAFPFLRIPRIEGYHQAEDAFALAITRQESEFNTNAMSRVGARGLMQFMPATANSQARRMGLPHQTSWLTSRPVHNLTLGAAHLADLIDDAYGSYVMTMIGYNAGPRRATQWVETYGEIRAIDPDTAIDWVEMIPFSETRNYVQRVMENMQVYRARLNNDSAPLRILEDLVRGTKPPPTFQVRVMPGADRPGGPAPDEGNGGNGGKQEPEVE